MSTCRETQSRSATPFYICWYVYMHACMHACIRMNTCKLDIHLESGTTPVRHRESRLTETSEWSWTGFSQCALKAPPLMAACCLRLCCLDIRWLAPTLGFYVPDGYCQQVRVCTRTAHEPNAVLYEHDNNTLVALQSPPDTEITPKAAT